MKILKWLLYVVLVLVALGLILPLFLPKTVKVSSEQVIALSPAKVFHVVAGYTGRGDWDPWLETEPGAEWTVDSKPGYVGSTYNWNGEKIGSGRMQVDSVVFGKYIASSIFFGRQTEPSLVEWEFETVPAGTQVRWSFTAKTAYPVERLFLHLTKSGLKKDLTKGTGNLKSHLEANPPVLSSLSEFSEGQTAPMFAMVAGTSSRMEEIGMKMDTLFTLLMDEITGQDLQISGVPFSHYLTYDESTGISNYLVGIPVATVGAESGDITPMTYKAMKVVQAIHTGPYEELHHSYEKFEAYLKEKMIETTGEVFEFYLTDPDADPNPLQLQTLIAFPLK